MFLLQIKFLLIISIFQITLEGTKVKIENLFPEYTKDIYSGYLTTLIEGNNLFYIYIQVNPILQQIEFFFG